MQGQEVLAIFIRTQPIKAMYVAQPYMMGEKRSVRIISSRHIEQNDTHYVNRFDNKKLKNCAVTIPAPARNQRDQAQRVQSKITGILW